MTNLEIEKKLTCLVRTERKITQEILDLINLALEKRSYLEFGYGSMFDWLTKAFGYSTAAAYRRIEAAKLVKAIPEISAKLENGTLNLSTLSKAQTIIFQHEKITGEQVTAGQKKEIIKSIENKSFTETEQILIKTFPEAASTVHQERKVVIDQNQIRLMMNFPNEALKNLQRAKEVLSHKFPRANNAEILCYALDFMLLEIDPLRRVRKTNYRQSLETIERFVSKNSGEKVSTPVELKSKSNVAQLAGTAPASSSSIAQTRRNIIEQANASCTYKNPRTGRVCGSRHQIQIDHIKPKALDGGDEPENLRVLCRLHNMMMAEKSFGKEHMERVRKS